MPILLSYLDFPSSISILFLSLVLAGFSMSFLPQKGVFETVVFSMESDSGITYGYRIPSLITTDKGALLAFAERRRGLHDHAQNDIVLKRSFDQGKSWSELQIIADFGKKSLNDPLAVQLTSGRILLLFQE